VLVYDVKNRSKKDFSKIGSNIIVSHEETNNGINARITAFIYAYILYIVNSVI